MHFKIKSDICISNNSSRGNSDINMRPIKQHIINCIICQYGPQQTKPNDEDTVIEVVWIATLRFVYSFRLTEWLKLLGQQPNWFLQTFYRVPRIGRFAGEHHWWIIVWYRGNNRGDKYPKTGHFSSFRFRHWLFRAMTPVQKAIPNASMASMCIQSRDREY